MGHIKFFAACLLGIAASALTVGCVRSPQEKPTSNNSTQTSASSFTSAVASADVQAALQAAESIKKEGFKRSDVEKAWLLWRNRSAELSKFEASADRDAVSVALMDVLLQARANGFFEIDESELVQMQTRLTEIAQTDLWPTVLRAISALGAIDDSRTAIFLGQLAKEKNSDYFRAAVVSLALMCNPKATETLDNLNKDSRSSSDKQFLSTTLETYARVKRDHSYCEKRLRLFVVK